VPHSILPPLATESRLKLTREELERWGEAFGRNAAAPLVVTIAGDLGAGKTTLARAICRGYGVTDADVTSPTYAIVHEYAAPRSPVFHLDLYRLREASELTNIGWDEIVEAEALVLIEWPERAATRAPRNAVPITLEHVDGDPDRRVLLAG
jgi:tRNA threonylcarbamoyladenosine biosynthesis protein TsaE